jgi:penicillin amidase
LRGIHRFQESYDVIVADALRMVADLGDDDKVLAVLPGGVAGRVFHPHYRDQVDEYLSGETVYWWFSDDALAEHTKTILHLSPK